MSDTTTTKRRVGGRPFAKGYDPRRRIFTPEEQREHFYILLAVLAERYPDRPQHNVLSKLIAKRARG
jgi:hypothetical protein